MDLSVMPPVAPMLAKSARTLPAGQHLLYEPKWDGFRTIVFRDGDEVELGSRNSRSLTRYFPELVAAIRSNVPDRCVLDGEIVVAGRDGLDFEALQQRIHPAASRVARLAEETPASLVTFDALCMGDRDLRSAPLSERRSELESALAHTRPPVHVTPATIDPSVAEEWFARFEGAGLDGVVAKDLGLGYRPGERVMVKVKHDRTADCVVGGFRWHKHGGIVGSLLLGLYDGQGSLHHVGVTSSFTMARRAELVDELAPYLLPEGAEHPWSYAVGDPAEAAGRRPGSQSRWSAGRDLSFQPLRPDLVCEVSYGQLQSGRFRHAVTFRRFRPDRSALSCTFDQLETVVPEELSAALAGG
jgi:ATP-dependent DNA ligase